MKPWIKRIFIAAALLPALAYAGDTEIKQIKLQNMGLSLNMDLCIVTVQNFIARPKLRRAESAEQCSIKGKEKIKSAYAATKATLSGEKGLAELTEWRLEWMYVFDATVIQIGDTDDAYVQRVREARTRVDRATNKFEIAVE